MESLLAEDIIFLSGRQINDTDASIPAKVVIHDNSDIISQRQGYLATVTRFNISGQETLFYHPGSDQLSVTTTIYQNDEQVSPTKTTTLDESMYTVSDMIARLNYNNLTV